MDQLLQVAIWQVIERQNYRQSYDSDFVQSIAGDMSSTGFKMEYPITVYPNGDDTTYTVIDGHTRRQAALLASTYTLTDHKPVLSVWVVVKSKPDDKQFKLQQLSANELRVEPDDISKAIGYQQAITAGATIDDLVSATGHKAFYIEKRLRFLTLTSEAQHMIANRQLSPDYADELTRLKPEYQSAALSAYKRASRHDLQTFKDIVSDLYQKQVEADNKQLPMFGGNLETFIAETVKAIEEKREKTRAELEAELAAERIARQRDRDYAKQKYIAAMSEIARLKAELYDKQLIAA